MSYLARLHPPFKTYQIIFSNKMEQDRLSDLGLISIESQLLTEVMETKQFFQDSVITEFASAEKRMEFTFK